MDISGIYYVEIKRAEDKNIFFDSQDKKIYMKLLKLALCGTNTKMYAFCMLKNTIFLLLREGIEKITELLSKVNIKYRSYFFYKYRVIERLPQKGIKIKLVSTKAELKELVRYIHRAELTEKTLCNLEECKSTSYADYQREVPVYINSKDILELFSKDINIARKRFISFCKKPSIFKEIEFENQIQKTEKEILVEDIIKAFLIRRKITMDELLKEENIKYREQLKKRLKKEKIETEISGMSS